MVGFLLPGLIQKPIVSADQRRPKPLQMKGFEFGPSVALRLSSRGVCEEGTKSCRRCGPCQSKCPIGPMAVWRSTKYSRMAAVPIPGTTSGPGKRPAGQEIGKRITLFAAALEAAFNGEEQTQTGPEGRPQIT